MRWPIDLVALLFVASEAKLSLLGFAHQLVAIAMHLVARVARHIGSVVLATSPQSTFEILAVASLADRATFVGCGGGKFADNLTKTNIGLGLLFSIGRFVRMGITGPMTTHAIGHPFIDDEAMGGSTHVGQILAIVAGDAKL